jgi:hypothetical protein
MGNFWENSELKREDVEKNIADINQITKSLIYMSRYKIHLKFELDDVPIQKMNRKIIKVKIYNYDEKKKEISNKLNSLHIAIEDFYKYYNLLMDLRRVFLNEQMEKNINNLTTSQIKELGENESSICPICCENNVDMSLPCSHFFCEKCIKAWIGKNESCPLCRYKLTVNRKEPTGIKGGQSWNVIDEIDPEQVDRENEESLQKLTNKLFIQKI